MRRYCLYCFETLEDDECRACGMPDRKAFRARYWNFNPAIRRLQRRLNLALLIGAGLFLFLLFRIGVHLPAGATRGYGFAYLLPIAAFAAGRLATSALTRERTDVRPAVLWSLGSLLLVLVSLVTLSAPGLLLGFAFLAPVGVISSRFDQWKERLQREGDPALLQAQLEARA